MSNMFAALGNDDEPAPVKSEFRSSSRLLLFFVLELPPRTRRRTCRQHAGAAPNAPALVLRKHRHCTRTRANTRTLSRRAPLTYIHADLPRSHTISFTTARAATSSARRTMLPALYNITPTPNAPTRAITNATPHHTLTHLYLTNNLFPHTHHHHHPHTHTTSNHAPSRDAGQPH
jgi:hypothetical protein